MSSTNAALLPPIIDNTTTAFERSSALRIEFYFQYAEQLDRSSILVQVLIDNENALIVDDLLHIICARASSLEDPETGKYYCEIPIAAFKKQYQTQHGLQLNTPIHVAIAALAKDRPFATNYSDILVASYGSNNYLFVAHPESHSLFSTMVTFHAIARPSCSLSYSQDGITKTPINFDEGITFSPSQVALALYGEIQFEDTQETDALAWYELNIVQAKNLYLTSVDGTDGRAYPDLLDHIITQDSARNQFAFTSSINFLEEALNNNCVFQCFFSCGTQKGYTFNTSFVMTTVEQKQTNTTNIWGVPKTMLRADSDELTYYFDSGSREDSDLVIRYNKEQASIEILAYLWNRHPQHIDLNNVEILCQRALADSEMRNWENIYTSTINIPYKTVSWADQRNRSSVYKIIDYTAALNTAYYYRIILKEDKSNNYVQIASANPALLDMDTCALITDKAMLLLPADLTISNLKQNIQETVTPTLNQIYPQMTRNGHQIYKSFSLSALLLRTWNLYNSIDVTNTSNQTELLSDTFLTVESPYIYNTFLNGSDRDNALIKECLFRKRVLEFLTQNTTFLFKSPTEGNICVKLTNVNFSPKSETGGIFYTFSAEATEVFEATRQNLIQFFPMNTLITNNLFSPITVASTMPEVALQITGFTEAEVPEIELADVSQTIDTDRGLITIDFTLDTAPDTVHTKACVVNVYRFPVTHNIVITPDIQPIYKMAVLVPPTGDYHENIEDLTVEPGESYIYLLGVSYLNKTKEEEYMFYKTHLVPMGINVDMYYLTTKSLMLKLLYDVSVSNLKYNHLNIVTPTLNGAYPFVRRNGKQAYRSFEIEALLSLQLEIDDDLQNNDESLLIDSRSPASQHQVELPYAFKHSLFLNRDQAKEDIHMENYKHFTLQTISYAFEKIYRDKAINFLYKDQIILFRSLLEGNMFIKLTEVTLSPRADLGRNIYTFHAVAIEVLPTTNENYFKYFSDYTDTTAVLEPVLVSGITGRDADSGQVTTEPFANFNYKTLQTKLKSQHTGLVNVDDIVHEMTLQAYTRPIAVTKELTKDTDDVWGDAATTHITYFLEKENAFAPEDKAQTIDISYHSVSLYQIIKETKGE